MRITRILINHACLFTDLTQFNEANSKNPYRKKLLVDFTFIFEFEAAPPAYVRRNHDTLNLPK